MDNNYIITQLISIPNLALCILHKHSTTVTVITVTIRDSTTIITPAVMPISLAQEHTVAMSVTGSTKVGAAGKEMKRRY